MRNVLAVVIVLLAFSAHAERKYEYKCWVTLTNGEQVISFQKLSPKNSNSRAKLLVEKKSRVSTPKGMKSVTTVHECVKLNQQFITPEAKALDEKTPR